ncbi:MAG: SAP domain-containing protein [Nitrospiraceae bacterium]|nr:SAP domain-containing protein [Nitrospiraceae bacterium]
MNIKKVMAIAKQKGVKTANLNKTEIIKAIQRSEGNFDCYGSAASGFCDQAGCLWREDCLSRK